MSHAPSLRLFLLVGLIIGLAGLAPASPATAADGNAKAGKAIYEKHCIACHGKTGKGIGTLPNLSDPRTLAGRPDAQLFEKITNGGQGSGMPAWGGVLSEPQRWDVLAYIKTLAK
ncbi:MAG: cytochrome c [Nitrospirae bacterium]|nr:cytochrome c [Nitrospirota bacterium]